METLIPVMSPAPGERLLRYVGDCVHFLISDRTGRPPPKGWRALLRTTLGRATQVRREILEAHTRGLPLAGASWRDLPMTPGAQGWSLEFPLTETGFFKAKAYLIDPKGWQHWPEGPDLGISVHPATYRTGNTIYCAFARLFGVVKEKQTTSNKEQEKTFAPLDAENYTIIPPSGKLRDLIQQLPHIFCVLGCRILHLLPVNPTPTTYARFGRFGSPYATLDLTAIDPALVVFDRRTTGVDQFRELTYAAHLQGGRVFLDMVINHTGWGSTLQENHPEWFLRGQDGIFVSPGAWGTTWEDLVELKNDNVQLWDELSEAFLTWCRRGVDGFRCDAGYKVPVPAWQYIVARVQQEYPDTIFLLEGLGGAWEATEALLTDGGMQWAYSELFQNYTGAEVARYLDHSLAQSRRTGLLVHYSETHDNDRLAARGRAWSLLRNRLCALASVNGGFGFTCGVEWLAPEKIRVHGSTGLAWGKAENLLPELARLNLLLASHPCFFDGARLERLSPAESPALALLRISQEGLDTALVLVNTSMDKPAVLVLDFSEREKKSAAGSAQAGNMEALRTLPSWLDLLGQAPPKIEAGPKFRYTVTLSPGAAFCLSPEASPRGMHGEGYRCARLRAAWGIQALSRCVAAESLGRIDWRKLAQQIDHSAADFLALAAQLPANATETDVEKGLGEISAAVAFPKVVLWTLVDERRITPVPPGHWLLIQDTTHFRASLSGTEQALIQNVESIPATGGFVACFPPTENAGDRVLALERYTDTRPRVEAPVRYLPTADLRQPAISPEKTDLVLLTNGRGGMARLGVDLPRIQSKYDCVLAANLHPSLPVDRHVFAKRLRVWVNADGFLSPLDFQSLGQFSAGPPAVWDFVANAGDGRTVEIQVAATMLEGRNATLFRFRRPSAAQASGKQLPPEADVRLTARVDIEDRNFHWETHRNGGADHHFTTNTRPVEIAGGPRGFAFTPAADRQLWVVANTGAYHPQGEWSQNIPHPVEQSRGQVASGDAYSPGWFELPLSKGAEALLLVTAEPEDYESFASGGIPPSLKFPPAPAVRTQPGEHPFLQKLERALDAFIVRRGEGKTIIAGYPWFLDWGRDTFICARGLIAAGRTDDVRQIVLTFARFEKDGTLPNTIFGEDASNRDTSDAPLFFGLVCEELAANTAPVHQLEVAPGRALIEVLRSIATHYTQGTPNGIRMDPDSGLIWSPSHFTWMDTNYPAGTPREGYPVELQALWVRLLRYLALIDAAERQPQWRELAERAATSIERLFWLEDKGYYSDVLAAARGQSAAQAAADDALRSNCLFLVTLGLSDPTRARRCVAAVRHYLVVPGALRSLAPLPVSRPLPIFGGDGRLLNNPHEPYQGRYEGDEDTRRKPAYHNGTAWTWTYPVFCEALAGAWDFSPDATQAARAYLAEMETLMAHGCIGQLPEVVDGDQPHLARGCDAQSWAVTEAIRVWKLLESKLPHE